MTAPWLAKQFLRKDYLYILEHLSECILERRLSFNEDTIAYLLLWLNEYARGNYYICKVMSIILIYIEMDINYPKLKIVFNLQTYKTFPDISVTLK